MKTLQLFFIATALLVLTNLGGNSNSPKTNNIAEKKLSQEEKEERNKRIALAGVKAVSVGDLKDDVVNQIRSFVISRVSYRKY